MNSGNNIKDSQLSREEIDTYRSTTDEGLKHSIEKNALENDFDSDALDGWSDQNSSLSQMKRLDKRFMSSNKLFYWIAGTVTVIVLSGAAFFFLDKDQSISIEDKSVSKNEVIIEKTDLVLPSKIEEMEELPKKEQIAVKTIVKDFSQQQKAESDDKISPSEVDKLPVKPIEEPKTPEVQLAKESFLGKEIYLKDLKLLDYRAYRSRPKVTTKQMILTGTPANIGEETEKEEEYEWRDVEIPYIDYLEKTIELFSKGQNKKALARFEVILDNYPDDLNANFYAGLCYFNLKEYSNAYKSFEKCMATKFTNFEEEAEWYSAKSLLANGQKEEAKKKFSEIQAAGGYYSVQAKKMISTL